MRHRLTNFNSISFREMSQWRKIKSFVNRSRNVDNLNFLKRTLSYHVHSQLHITPRIDTHNLHDNPNI